MATCSTWSPGSPRPARRAGPRRGEAAASSDDLLGYTVATGVPELREAIAGHHRRARHRRRPRRRRRHHRLERRLPARGLPRRLRARRPGGDGPARLSLLPQRPDRARLRGGRASTAVPRPASSRPSRSSRPPGTSRGVVSPAPPTRPAPCCCPTSSPPRPLVRGARGPADLRRDLPRHRVRPARGTRAALPLGLGDLPRGDRLLLVLQVLLDDRLADRLDAGARAPAPTGRRAHRQLHDLPAGARPVGGGRARSTTRRTPSSTATSRGTPATGGCSSTASPRSASPAGAGRRRVLRLRRRRPPDRRLHAWCPRCSPRPGSRWRPASTSTPSEGHRFVRLSFAGAADEITRALDRLDGWLR